jgi:RNA-dependent RNA polymerase
MHNIAYAAKEIDVRIAVAEKLHRPPFPTDPPLNFRVHLFKSKKGGCGMLTLPTHEVGDTFLRTYGHTSIIVKGRKIMFRLSDKPVNEGRVRHIRSIQWEDPNALEERNRQKAADSQPIELQGYAFGHFCRNGSFLVDSDTLGNGDIACDLDRRQIRLTVRQGTSNVPEMVDDLDSSMFGLHLGSAMNNLFSPTKSASYMPPQIKTVIATDPSQTPYLVILDSDTPPVFESRSTIFSTLNIFNDLGFEDRESSHRLPSLHDDRQTPPRCHSLCLTFRSHNESLIFLERCRGLGLTSIQNREDEILTRHVSYNDAMAELDDQLLTMKFELAFEVEKAVLNGDLEPFEIQSLGGTIHALSSTAGGLPAAAFRLFVTTLQGFRPAFPHRRRRRMRSGGLSTTKAADLSLDQQLINATKYYSTETSLKMTSFLVSPATFESYHLIVTPTSRYLEGPIADQSNSILRRFGNHECFLRVSIQDERRSKLRREPGIDISNLLQSRFGNLLIHGLRLGGRQYEFLGYSMSGLREHSVWFVTPFESNTGWMDAEKIREKLVRPCRYSKG